MTAFRLTILVATVAIGMTAAAIAQQRQAMPAQAVRDRVEHPVAEFAGLDKITGRIIKFDVRIGETVQFGALQVTPRACAQRLTGTRDHVGFVEVDEITLRNEIRRIFSGWMFASSPGLNAVEHPIYDIWLGECKGGNVPQVAAGPQAGYQGEGDPTPLENAPRRRPAPPRPQGQPQPSPQEQPFRPTGPGPAIQPGVPFDPSQLPPR
jgi:hypothetical protein